MKRFLPLAVLGVAQALFLAVAFFAGYIVRATDFDAQQPFNLPSAGTSKYAYARRFERPTRPRN